MRQKSTTQRALIILMSRAILLKRTKRRDSAFSLEVPEASRRKEHKADKRNSRGAVSFFREAESSLDQFAMDNSSLRCNNSPAEVAEWERKAERQSLA
jgi:hypothetical protein